VLLGGILGCWDGKSSPVKDTGRYARQRGVQCGFSTDGPGVCCRERWGDGDGAGCDEGVGDESSWMARESGELFAMA
jgi:hypothetical protein